ncbi:MAG: YbaB/EbfC family nucleoid-associated protein [Clostridia bacterium]|nr:YbaB/EbfC family nucleoid-associated protein [Clostridia bacterium]
MKARLPQGMGGGPQNMNHVIKQAQKMREDAEALQEVLDEKEYDISAGGGMVTVKIKGTKEILDIKISPDVIDPEDPETLQDILIAAVNEAIRKVEETNATEMEKITGSLNIPGLF